MRVLITGANGHLGLQLIKRLQSTGEEVVAAVRSERARQTIIDSGLAPEIHIIDYTRAEEVESAASGCDTVVHLVLERSQDFSRVVTFDGGVIGTLPGLTEAALVEAVAGPLDAARALPKDGSLRTDAGVEVRATSFEHFVKELAGAGPLYLLDRRGDDIEGLTDVPDSTFVLTDHTPLPRNTARWLRRLGAKPLALGPTTLFASQCVTLLHSRLDRAAGF